MGQDIHFSLTNCEGGYLPAKAFGCRPQLTHSLGGNCYRCLAEQEYGKIFVGLKSDLGRIDAAGRTS